MPLGTTESSVESSSETHRRRSSSGGDVVLDLVCFWTKQRGQGMCTCKAETMDKVRGFGAYGDRQKQASGGVAARPSVVVDFQGATGTQRMSMGAPTYSGCGGGGGLSG